MQTKAESRLGTKLLNKNEKKRLVWKKEERVDDKDMG